MLGLLFSLEQLEGLKRKHGWPRPNWMFRGGRTLLVSAKSLPEQGAREAQVLCLIRFTGNQRGQFQGFQVLGESLLFYKQSVLTALYRQTLELFLERALLFCLGKYFKRPIDYADGTCWGSSLAVLLSVIKHQGFALLSKYCLLYLSHIFAYYQPLFSTLF